MRILLSFIIFGMAWIFPIGSMHAFGADSQPLVSAPTEKNPPAAALRIISPENNASQSDIETKDLPFFQRILKRAETAWTDGNIDIYVPLYAWHNRFMYHSNEASDYNEIPWGIGFGKSFYDEDGDFHGLFIMGFEDSNYHFQPVMGYTYIKNWTLVDELKFGLGVAAGITARHEIYYIPFPAALPLMSLEYKNFSIQATYIPGQYNHGNVLFTWARWHFD